MRLKNKKIVVLVLSLCLIATTTPALAQIVEDNLPPELLYFDFTPTTIDVSSSDQNVVFTFRITDDLSGFHSCSFGLISPSGEQARRGTVWPSFHTVSGDILDDTYEYTLTFPYLSEGGTWTVSYITLFDEVGNRLDIDANDLNTMGFVSELLITGGEDLAPPILALFDFNPKIIDVSNGDQFLIFTIRVIDELSGFHSSSFTITSSTGRQVRRGTIWPLHRISGDAKDGTYEYKLKIVQYTESVIWHVTSLSVHDRVWNNIRLSEFGLQALGFPTEIDIFSDPDDITVPEVVDFSFTPLAIDTSAGPQQVTFTLHATDDLSSFYSSSFQIRSPSGTQARSGTFWPTHLIAGDEMDGVYKYTITIPQYSEIGLWYVSYLSIADDVWNQKIYRTNDLINMGVPPLQVVDGPLTTEATIDFYPDTLNLESEGKTVTVYIELPFDSDYTVSDIIVSTISLNGIVIVLDSPFEIGDYDIDTIPDLMIKFNRYEVQSILEIGEEIEILITGEFLDGRTFEGFDLIRTIVQ